MDIEFTAYKAFGITLCVAFIALMHVANRARSRQAGNARRVEPVRDDAEPVASSQYYYISTNKGGTVSVLANAAQKTEWSED